MKPAGRRWSLAGAAPGHSIWTRWNDFIFTLNLAMRRMVRSWGSLYRVEDVMARNGKLMTKSGVFLSPLATPTPPPAAGNSRSARRPAGYRAERDSVGDTEPIRWNRAVRRSIVRSQCSPWRARPQDVARRLRRRSILKTSPRSGRSTSPAEKDIAVCIRFQVRISHGR